MLLDPATLFGPHLACPARGQTGQGNSRLHSRKDRRFMGTACHKTVSATPGPACYRRRPSAETVSRVVTLMAHGGPLQALGVAFGEDERTVACGLGRAGGQGQAVQAHRVEQARDLGQGQADESRVKNQGGLVGMALAMLVKTRLGWAGEVSEPRDMTLIRPLIQRVRAGALHRPLLFCPDGLCSSSRAIRETCRDPVRTGEPGRPRLRQGRNRCAAQVVQRYAQRRVIAIERRIGEGTPTRVETRRRHSPGAGVIKTADIARLHATCRERRASLTRRGRALARRTETLPHGRHRLGTVYHFCTPHARLSAVGITTPAMAAGITDHCWSVRA